MKYVPPSVRETAFNCPHCGVLTTQFWHTTAADSLKGRPLIVDAEKLERATFDDIKNEDKRAALQERFKELAKGRPFLRANYGSHKFDTGNIWISRCYNCSELAVWVYDAMIYPKTGEAPPANPDMSEDIRRDYDEASAILDLSPRGAAALVRLCIQKLCKELGKPGKNINDDIGALVKEGLDSRVQQALDAVRVKGNQAVHPGEIDLRDDRATADTLFKLLNLIVEKMISEPKHIDEVYAALPKGALDAIGKRDGKQNADPESDS